MPRPNKHRPSRTLARDTPSALPPPPATTPSSVPVAAPPDPPRWILPALLAVSLLLSILFALRVPYDANPDEQGHFDYVRLLVTTHKFVRFVPNDPALVEVHQPPLYYLFCVPFYAMSSGNLFATRLLAVFLQLGTIIVVYRACRDLFPHRPELAVGAAAFVTFLPTQAQLGGAVNNDSLTTLLCAALFWRMGRLMVHGISRRESVIIGLLFGAALLTKFSTLQLLPPLLIALALSARKSGNFGAALRGGAVILGIALVIASPWLVRNTLLYGDPLTLQIYRQTGANKTPAEIMQISRIPQIGGNWEMPDYIRNVAVRSFATFWYFLPPTLPPNSRFIGSPLLVLIVLLLALGGAWGAYLFGKANPDSRPVLILFAAGIACIVPFFARFVLTVFQAQGRYFLPALLPAALLCVAGWAQIGGKRSRPLGALLPGAVLLLLTVVALSRGGYMP